MSSFETIQKFCSSEGLTTEQEVGCDYALKISKNACDIPEFRSDESYSHCSDLYGCPDDDYEIDTGVVDKEIAQEDKAIVKVREESDDLSGKKLLCDENQNPRGKSSHPESFRGYHFLDSDSVEVYFAFRIEKPRSWEKPVESYTYIKKYFTDDSEIIIMNIDPSPVASNIWGLIDRTDTHCEVYTGDLKLFFKKKTDELKKLHEQFKSRRKI